MPQDKETVIEMLQQASELEHSLCVQYLYGALTLKAGGDPGLTASQAALTGQWGQQIMRIAIQEMYHLLLASNMLTAMGSGPNLWRPNFPQPATRYSQIDLPSLLAPFGLETASRFLCWERPDQPGWWDGYCATCSQQIQARLGLSAAPPPPYSSIGQLYGLIRQALSQHPEWIDPQSASRQVTSQIVPFKPTVAPITTADQAAAYIDIIVREGEGTPDWQSMSHFAYFHQIANQLQGLQDGSPPSFAWPTVENPIYNPADELPGATVITDPDVQAVGLLFNDLYQFLVTILVRLFIPEGETESDRQSLANTAMALMPLGIKPLGILLTRLPAGEQYPGLYAGPSFELPQPAPSPVGPKEEIIPALYDTLAAITARCRVLSIELTPLGPEALSAVGAVAARLETLLPLLRLGSQVEAVS